MHSGDWVWVEGSEFGCFGFVVWLGFVFDFGGDFVFAGVLFVFVGY